MDKERIHKISVQGFLSTDSENRPLWGRPELLDVYLPLEEEVIEKALDLMQLVLPRDSVADQIRTLLEQKLLSAQYDIDRNEIVLRGKKGKTVFLIDPYSGTIWIEEGEDGIDGRWANPALYSVNAYMKNGNFIQAVRLLMEAL